MAVLQEKPKKVVQFKHRPGTQDEMVVREVMQENEYRLPPHFDPYDFIIDIGAHIGAFALACLARGASVLAIEPDVGNFALLIENLRGYVDGGRARHARAAVWKPGTGGFLKFSGYPEQMNACGTCLPGFLVGGENKAITVVNWSLDEILGNTAWTFGDRVRLERDNRPENDLAYASTFFRSRGDRVRLLKIDAEGAEYGIIYTSKKLGLIDEIVMEVHEWGGMPEAAQVEGFAESKHYTAQGLADFLTIEGFECEIKYKNAFPYAGRDGLRMANLWARRK